jgi:hypothetical protein
MAFAVTTAGCPAAPTRVDFEMQLGPREVRYHARLHDVRAAARDLSESLPIFAHYRVLPPEAEARLDWLPRPDVYRWVAGDAGVDLEIAGSLPRFAFDECARRGCSALDGGQPCTGFPLILCGDRYAMIERRRDLPDAGPWPADAGEIRHSFTTAEKTAREGFSLLPAYQAHVSAPDSFAATDGWLHDFADSFQRGDVRALRELLAGATVSGTTGGVPALQQAVEQAVLHEWRRLLFAYLSTHTDWRYLQPEPSPAGDTYLLLVPPRPFSAAANEKLRAIYLETTGPQPRATLRDVAPMLRQVCDRRAVRQTARKRFCELLLLHAEL